MNHRQNKLIKNIEKKFTTIMIGALARFENHFGYLWDEKSPNGDDFYHQWEQARHEILNFGNHHIRTGIEELYEYFINDKKPGTYYYEFKPNNNQGDQDR